VDPEFILDGIRSGVILLLSNINHREATPVAIGRGLRTKVNANIGTSRDLADPALEKEKAIQAWKAGADTLMDLSTGGDIDAFRRDLLRSIPIPLGTVPVYQAGIETVASGRPRKEMDPDLLFSVIEKHVRDGVDFLTVHCGVTLACKERMQAEGRLMDVVSRGGAFHLEWMVHQGRENPLYEQFDRLLEIAHAFDAALSLGDGFRPGCVADATDRAQIQELIVLGELAERARKAGVQVMIEGPGHVPLDQIASNIALEKGCATVPHSMS
jgi:phosphomethylpyrimidine synthase